MSTPVSGYRSAEEQRRVLQEYLETGKRSVFGEAWLNAPTFRMTAWDWIYFSEKRSTHEFGLAIDSSCRGGERQ